MRLIRSTAPDFKSVYTDNVQISANFFGLTTRIGTVTQVTDSELHVLDSFALNMSPEHARSFHKLLGEQLEKYRESFGELRDEPTHS